MTKPLKKPDWIKVRPGHGAEFKRVRDIVQGGGLHTVCEEALCPNRGQCWEHGRATLMILGDRCTRGCSFCGVSSRQPAPVDMLEPHRVGEAVKSMGLKDVVITSVTRDDLPDGGAAIWAETIQSVREAVPGILVEVLVPDFAGNWAALDVVLASRPDVFGHNLETVPSAYARARPQADYDRSLEVLQRGSDVGLLTKTGVMVGLGETEKEVLNVMRDARAARVSILYAGQYLQPSREHLAVSRYVTPEEFDRYRQAGLSMGFGVVVSGPLVRSSYHSEEQAQFVSAASANSAQGFSVEGQDRVRT